MKKLNKKGFTIVELVIVIAVIAILAAVLVPTFGGILKKANDSASLQAVTAAYKVYLADVSSEGGIPEDKIVVYHDDAIIVIEGGAAKIVDNSYDVSLHVEMEIGDLDGDKGLVDTENEAVTTESGTETDAPVGGQD